jgi:hypothetical protein
VRSTASLCSQNKENHTLKLRHPTRPLSWVGRMLAYVDPQLHPNWLFTLPILTPSLLPWDIIRSPTDRLQHIPDDWLMMMMKMIFLEQLVEWIWQGKPKYSEETSPGASCICTTEIDHLLRGTIIAIVAQEELTEEAIPVLWTIRNLVLITAVRLTVYNIQCTPTQPAVFNYKLSHILQELLFAGEDDVDKQT